MTIPFRRKQRQKTPGLSNMNWQRQNTPTYLLTGDDTSGQVEPSVKLIEAMLTQKLPLTLGDGKFHCHGQHDAACDVPAFCMPV